MAPAMPCKMNKKCKHGETSGKTNEFKSKLACILEASESTRLRMEESLPNYYEDHIAGKGDNSLQHYNLVDKFIPVPQAMKIPAAWAAVDKECEKLEQTPAWDLTKVRSEKEEIDESRTKGACRIGGKAPKIQKAEPRWHCERWFRIIRSIHRTRIISFSNDSRKKSWISSPDCQVAMDKQQTQYRLTPKWKWKMLTNYWKFQNRSVQTFGFVYHDTSGLNHGPVWKTQSFLSEGICTVILWQDYYGKGNLRKSYWNMAGKNSKLGMSLCSSWKKDYSFLCMWMT